MENVKRKNYLNENLKGIVTGFLGSILCTLGFAFGQGIEEHQWLGKFDWYGFLCMMIGGVFGSALQFVIIAEIFNWG